MVNFSNVFIAGREDMVRGVTTIQVKVTSPGVLSAVINWIPPKNQNQIRGNNEVPIDFT